jgi:hypothetical protein
MRRRMLFLITVLPPTLACSEIGTPPRSLEPSGAPALAVQGGGNPKFSNKDTNCDATGTSITCSYKITGLGNTDLVDVFVSASVTVSGDCRNHGGQIVEAQDFTGTVTGSRLNQQPENGQITGTLTLLASSASNPSAPSVCPNGNWTLANVSKSFVGDADLYALVHHQDGSTLQIDSAF